jgi:hypothetical protein
MKKLILFLVLAVPLLWSGKINSQSTECPTTANLTWLQANAPDRYQRFIDLENFTANYISSQARLVNTNGLIIIPVVVHVLHRNEPEGQGFNISMAQIQAQIDLLNLDFRRLNVDGTNTPAPFLPVASDLNIQFQLACIDPNGASTNGVVRKYTSKESFVIETFPDRSTDDESTGIKTSSTGDVAWPTDRYLNIWTCNLRFTTGYATFPADYSIRPQFDGIVVRSSSFAGYSPSTGRTATHEIGHWLNLHHLNGDSDDITVCGDDFCNDTPLQNGSPVSGCPTYPYTANRCNTSYPSTMPMNFMGGVVNDNCLNLFTNDQKLRARALFASGGPREAQLNNWFKVRSFTEQPILCNGLIYSSPMCLQTTWTVLSGPANLTPGPGVNQATLQPTGVGNVLIRATSGNYISEDNITVSNLPPPSPGPISVILVDYHLGKIQVVIDSVPGATSYNWYKNGVLLAVPQGIGAQIPIARTCNVGYSIEVEAVNSCGTSAKTYKGVFVPCDNNFIVSPNPATSTLVISANTNVMKAVSAYSVIDKIGIYDVQSNLKAVYKANKARSATINLRNLINGTYIIEITSGTYKERQQLIIQR